MSNARVTAQMPTILERPGSRTHSLLAVLFTVYLVLLAWVMPRSSRAAGSELAAD